MSEWSLDSIDLDTVDVRLEEEGAVLRVRLDAPPGNILDAKMMISLRRVVEAARPVKQLRLIVLEGAGENFSFGASVEEHLPEHVGGMLENFHSLFRALIDTDIPLAALVRGQCLGGGLEMAAFCDRVIVEAGAQLGQPEIKLGVFAPIGSLLLPWRCGARGAGLALTGRSISAEKAVAIGLADECVDAGAGEAAVQRWWAEELRPLSAASLRHARQAVRWNLNRLLRDGIPEMEILYLDELMKTGDAVEGIRAFLDKRDPNWSHG